MPVVYPQAHKFNLQRRECIMRQLISKLWDSERGEFTENFMTVQYFISLAVGIICVIAVVIAR